MILLILLFVFLISAVAAVLAARAVLAFLFSALMQPKESALVLTEANPAL
ncbi:MAG TPA: hypothetical protein VN737_20310 [Bryobacteraceae bacterium]|nr:hypothetical protein [Bryobacteraceae bacterium]